MTAVQPRRSPVTSVALVFLFFILTVFASGCLTTTSASLPAPSGDPEIPVAASTTGSLWTLSVPPVLDAIPPEPESSPERPESQPSSLREKLIMAAMAYLGTRYRYGGESRRGFDCSGFVQTVFERFGIKLPRSSREQFAVGEIIHKSELKPGDVIAFDAYFRGRVSHVGIYLGHGKMIHANRRGGSVRVTDFTKGYYRDRLVGCVRFIDDNVAPPDSVARDHSIWNPRPLRRLDSLY